MTSEALRTVLEKYLSELEAKTQGQVTVEALEQSLIDMQGPLLSELLHTLLEQRQGASFPPSTNPEPCVA